MSQEILALQSLKAEVAPQSEGEALKGSFFSYAYCNGWGSSLVSAVKCY